MSSNIRVQRICQFCGNEFTAKTTVTKYCGDGCAKKAYKARKRRGKIEKSNIETRLKTTLSVDELKAKPYLSVEDAKQLLGISKRTIYRLIEKGEINTAKFGRRIIIRREDLEKIFEPDLDVESKLYPKKGKAFKKEDCYTISEVLEKYSISIMKTYL